MKITIALAGALLLLPGAALAQDKTHAPAADQAGSTRRPPTVPSHSFIRGLTPMTKPPLRPLTPLQPAQGTGSTQPVTTSTP